MLARLFGAQFASPLFENCIPPTPPHRKGVAFAPPRAPSRPPLGRPSDLAPKFNPLKRLETTKEIFGDIWSDSDPPRLVYRKNRFRINELWIGDLIGGITRPGAWRAKG
jgi:hypothetical protein